MKTTQKLFCHGRRRLSIAFLSLFVVLTINMTAGEKNSEWTKSATVDNVNFYYKIVNCNNDDFVLLKFENKNDQKATISWTEKFIVADKPAGFTYNKAKSLEISPGVTSQEDCENISNKSCVITLFEIDPTYHPSVTGFEFENIQVKVN